MTLRVFESIQISIENSIQLTEISPRRFFFKMLNCKLSSNSCGFINKSYY